MLAEIQQKQLAEDYHHESDSDTIVSHVLAQLFGVETSCDVGHTLLHCWAIRKKWGKGDP